MRIINDTWLTGIFGYPVFNVIVSHDDQPGEKMEESLVQHIKAQSKAMYCAKIETATISISQQLQKLGFYIIDTNITMERAVRPTQEFHVAHGIIVKDFSEQYVAVLEIARSCFRHSRFHLDPAIPKAIADQIKYEWVKSYTRGLRGDRLLVAVKEDQVIGFLATVVSKQEGKTVAVSELLGVPYEFQNVGIGRVLLEAFIQRYQETCDAVQCGGIYTSNIQALRLYERMGFLAFSSKHILHLHI